MTYITVGGVFTTSVVNLSKLEFVGEGLDIDANVNLIGMQLCLIGMQLNLIGIKFFLIGINGSLIGIKPDLFGIAQFFQYKNPFTKSEGIHGSFLWSHILIF
ncbi:hypothetical protein [Paenisporosarcina sp. NPDC076898]|uniref:hypothetical protein n=1 Tax=unclassified Paenisporosarcina TaxID=2642018 RepID=UPI003CFEC1C6